MKRIAIIARLKEGTRKQAIGLLASGPPFDLDESRFDRHAVYLSNHDVVFVFEGDEVEWLVDSVVSDRHHWLLAAALAAWKPLVEGSPQVAREVFSWESTKSTSTAPAPPA